jgi:hypothetical protein
LLVFPLHQVAGDGFQAVGARAVGLENGEGFFDEAGGVALALLDAENGRPGGFFGSLVFTGCLAQVSRVHGQIEYIIDDLKGQTGLAAKEIQAGSVVAVAPA